MSYTELENNFFKLITHTVVKYYNKMNLTCQCSLVRDSAGQCKTLQDTMLGSAGQCLANTGQCKTMHEIAAKYTTMCGTVQDFASRRENRAVAQCKTLQDSA